MRRSREARQQSTVVKGTLEGMSPLPLPNPVNCTHKRTNDDGSRSGDSSPQQEDIEAYGALSVSNNNNPSEVQSGISPFSPYNVASERAPSVEIDEVVEWPMVPLKIKPPQLPNIPVELRTSL